MSGRIFHINVRIRDERLRVAGSSFVICSDEITLEQLQAEIAKKEGAGRLLNEEYLPWEEPSSLRALGYEAGSYVDFVRRAPGGEAA